MTGVVEGREKERESLSGWWEEGTRQRQAPTSFASLVPAPPSTWWRAGTQCWRKGTLSMWSLCREGAGLLTGPSLVAGCGTRQDQSCHVGGGGSEILGLCP